MKTLTFKVNKTVKHPFRTDANGKEITQKRTAQVKVNQLKTFEELQDFAQNDTAFILAIANEWMRRKGQATANNHLLGMSGGNEEIKEAMRDFKRALEFHAELGGDTTLEEFANVLLTKKRFECLAPVFAVSGEVNIPLDYTGTETVTLKDGKEVTLPILRPKMANVPASVDEDEDEDVSEDEDESEDEKTAPNTAKRSRK